MGLNSANSESNERLLAPISPNKLLGTSFPDIGREDNRRGESCSFSPSISISHSRKKESSLVGAVGPPFSLSLPPFSFFSSLLVSFVVIASHTAVLVLMAMDDVAEDAFCSVVLFKMME